MAEVDLLFLAGAAERPADGLPGPVIRSKTHAPPVHASARAVWAPSRDAFSAVCSPAAPPPPTMATLPLVERATLVPNLPLVISLGLTGSWPCRTQADPERSKTRAAPEASFATGSPTTATSPSAEIATLSPKP